MNQALLRVSQNVADFRTLDGSKTAAEVLRELADNPLLERVDSSGGVVVIIAAVKDIDADAEPEPVQ